MSHLNDPNRSGSEKNHNSASVDGADPKAALTRRHFLGGVGIAAAGTIVGGIPAFPGGPVSEVEAAEIAPTNGSQREARSHRIRVQAAKNEIVRPVVSHLTNGDEELYPNRIGNFSKTLPHNDLGEVDPAAYSALLSALATGNLADFEAVPAGGNRTLLNPLGGLSFPIEGPDSVAVGVNPPPAIASPEFAAQMAELYWMALLRDVPLSDYGVHPLAIEAREDLATFSGYTGPRDPITGEIRPNDLFRTTYPGVQDGPMVSQFLLSSFRYDGIPIDPRISTAMPGVDFLTYFPEWLEAQRGFPSGGPGPDPRDPTLRYPRNARDLGRNAGQDTINSQYFKAMLVLLAKFGAGLGAALDAANPYNSTSRQSAFATFGIAHLVELIGKAHKAERHTWYQKWFVHRFLRPEVGGARVHNARIGAADYPIHPDLLVHSSVLPQIFESNRQTNLQRLGIDQGTYLLPQLFGSGSPTHPSFPAGHAISAGSCVTVLKAWFNEDAPFPDPKKPTADGLALDDYVPGVDGPELTIGGELNKLAQNLSFGRDMSGVHWRADNIEGNRQGEEVVIRMLREERASYPEPFDGFTLTKFDGETITL
ncbi:MAG: vanadium-dependent haloperoxidase [Gammaproteobacteria bacterium]